MKPNIGIADKNLKKVTELLSSALSTENVLYLKTRKFHWNVNGPSFMEFNKLFQEQYEKLDAAIDEIAERINKLGTPAIGTMEEFLQSSKIKEKPGSYPGSGDMIKELLSDHETCIIKLRKDIEECQEKYKDAGTADFLTGLMEEHETLSWQLRRYLK